MLELNVEKRTATLIAANEELQKEIAERKQIETALRSSEERYRYIFDAAAVSIWEEDFSAVDDALDELKNHGVTDLRAYFDEHPEFIEQTAQKIKILDVNQETLRIFKAESKNDLIGIVSPVREVFLQETLEFLKEEFIAIAERKNYFQGETILHNQLGTPLNILVTMAIPSRIRHIADQHNARYRFHLQDHRRYNTN